MSWPSRITAYLAGVQERVQAAERERAVAVARAVEERRRRKVQLALAVSVLAFTILGGLSTTYYIQQRAARAAAGQRIIDQVTTLRGQALAHREEIQRREVARAAVEQADPAGDPKTRAQLLAMRKEIEDGLVGAKRDKALIDRLVEIRSADSDGANDASITEHDYSESFREAGVDVAALRRPRRRPGSRPGHPGWPRRCPALSMRGRRFATERRATPRARPISERSPRAADPDPWRIKLRAALEEPHRASMRTALQALEKEAQFDRLSPISLYLLGAALRDVGDNNLADSVLQTAQRRHPRDLWINYTLGTVLEKLSRRDEAIRFFSIAARSVPRPPTNWPMRWRTEAIPRRPSPCSAS